MHLLKYKQSIFGVFNKEYDLQWEFLGKIRESLMEKQAVRPFGIRDKLGYMFGDFGNDFTFILSTMILMKFYTDVMGVSAGVVGTVMMIARFVDAFTDVTMGRICDRHKGNKNGKFKP